MNFVRQPPTQPPLPPTRFPGIAVDSFVGNYIPLPPQQYTQRQEGVYGPGGDSSSSYDKKRTRLRKFSAFPIMRITVLLTVVNLHILIATITLMVGRSHVQGGGRGGGRMSNNSQGGRGHYGRNSNSSYNNNSGNDDHHNRKTYADGNQGRGKSLFKHDMILDPWEQLAKRMVPQGLLDATELDNHFCPQVSVVQTSVRVSNPLSDGRLPARFENEGTDIEDDIEDLKAQLLDQI